MSIALVGDQQREKEANEGQNEDAEEGDDDSEENGDSDNSEEEDEDEDDTEAIARRLGDQLWADIQRARASTAASQPPLIPVVVRKSSKEEAALATMKTVLSYAASDPLVYSTLSSTLVPGFGGSTVLEMFSKILEDDRVTRQAAGPLSQVLVKLAKSEILFSPLPTLPQLLKRKREDRETGTPPHMKRAAVDEEKISAEAVDTIPEDGSEGGSNEDN
ncbi:hypothetical protein EW145_g2383 [Phellinidium pouzarii]|uniref:Uncharacterized protein n=1 Tax=Phellinidium pouzarii TaxID=167371 RepID=A0A4V3XDA0_9AGAM|nr:hypothetical protein EW145_g2383 [Phellinidium pouzarii]